MMDGLSQWKGDQIWSPGISECFPNGILDLKYPPPLSWLFLVCFIPQFSIQFEGSKCCPEHRYAGR
jgi:hypothetical protein